MEEEIRYSWPTLKGLAKARSVVESKIVGQPAFAYNSKAEPHFLRCEATSTVFSTPGNISPREKGTAGQDCVAKAYERSSYHHHNNRARDVIALV